MVVHFSQLRRPCPKCGNKEYLYLLYGDNVGELNVKCLNCNHYFKSSDLHRRLLAKFEGSFYIPLKYGESAFPIVTEFINSNPSIEFASYTVKTVNEDGDEI